MSTPDPVASPPPASNAKKWLVGCLIALVLAVLLVLVAALLIIYAAKRQVDAIKPDVQHLADDARRAAAALQSAAPVAQDIAQAAEARMRLGRAASAAAWSATQASTPQEPCQPELARAALPVDGEWFSQLVNGVPDFKLGTPWMRDPTIVQAATSTDPTQAMVALDRTLADAGAVAVIQRAASDAKAPVDDRHFQGYVQLIGYPDGERMCIVAFHAEGKDANEFQSSFWAAEEAALGK